MSSKFKVVKVRFYHPGERVSGDDQYSYFTDLDLAEGDMVVVEARNFYGIAFVAQTSDLSPSEINRATKWIVQKIDIARIADLKSKIAKIEQLRKEVEIKTAKAIRNETIKKIAKKYPELADLVSELEALESEVPNAGTD